VSLGKLSPRLALSMVEKAFGEMLVDEPALLGQIVRNHGGDPSLVLPSLNRYRPEEILEAMQAHNPHLRLSHLANLPNVEVVKAL
jgi:hypothetical protein